MSPQDPQDGAAGGSENVAPIDWEAFYGNYRKPGYIDGFEITSKLGGGMFGLVFKAVRQSIGKDYAIKFLKVDDHDVRHAVLNELESVRYFAQVDHPNLVSIEDRGVVDGIPYIVMAYAGSETLRTRLDDPHVDAHELLQLFLQACRGVHALHERSLVHFDLKPANIFIKGDVARVGDYGLSKLVSASRNSLSMGRGTPYYMAPEMLQRRGDFRSDVYSLGVILYECLTGEVPFKGDSEWEVLRAHETAHPEFPESMPQAYRAVILRCMAKAPEDRYESVAEIVDALRAASGAAPEASGAAPGIEPPPIPHSFRAGPDPRTPPPLPVGDAKPRRVVVPPPIPEAYRKSPAAGPAVGPDADPQTIAAAAAANARRVVGELGSRQDRDAIASEGRRAARGRKRIERKRAQAAREGRSNRRGSLAWPLLGVAAIGVVGLSVLALFAAGGSGHQVEYYQLAESRARAQASRARNQRSGERVLQMIVDGEPDPSQAVRVTIDGKPAPVPFGLQSNLPEDWLGKRRLIDYPIGTRISDREHIQEMVESLAVRTDFRPGYGRRLQEEGLAGLIGVVGYLQSLNMENSEHTRRAQRLCQFLADWTGVDSIEIIPISGDDYAAADARSFNQKGISAWRAILERYCADEQAFRTFLDRRADACTDLPQPGSAVLGR